MTISHFIANAMTEDKIDDDTIIKIKSVYSDRVLAVGYWFQDFILDYIIDKRYTVEKYVIEPGEFCTIFIGID